MSKALAGNVTKAYSSRFTLPPRGDILAVTLCAFRLIMVTIIGESDSPAISTEISFCFWSVTGLVDILNGKTLDHPLRFAALTGKKFRAEDKRMPVGARNKAIAEIQ